MKRLIVIGAGAVGGSIGGLLTLSGFPIVFVARGKHGERIGEHGLKLKWQDETHLIATPSHSKIGDVDFQPGDVAMVATKLQDARPVLNELLKCAGQQLPVVCATNGIHGECWAKERFAVVLSTMIWMPALHLEPGEVRLHAGPCPGVLDTGVVQPTDEVAANQLAENFCRRLRAAKFDAIAREDIQLWKNTKWISNLGNASQALVSDDWQAVTKAARAEGELVLATAGVAYLPMKRLLERVARVKNVPVEGAPREGGSTWQSLQRGQPLETPWIEGAIADLADQVGIPAPINRFQSEVARAPRKLLAEEVPGC